MEKNKNKNHICSNCIKEFSPKESFVALVPSGAYYTIYCKDCLNELGINDFKQYSGKVFNDKSTKK